MTYAAAATIRSTISQFTSTVIPPNVMAGYLDEADNWVNQSFGRKFDSTYQILEDIAKRYTLYLCFLDQFIGHADEFEDFADAQKKVAEEKVQMVLQRGFLLNTAGTAIELATASDQGAPQMAFQGDSYNFVFGAD